MTDGTLGISTPTVVRRAWLGSTRRMEFSDRMPSESGDNLAMGMIFG